LCSWLESHSVIDAVGVELGGFFGFVPKVASYDHVVTAGVVRLEHTPVRTDLSSVHFNEAVFVNEFHVSLRLGCDSDKETFSRGWGKISANVLLSCPYGGDNFHHWAFEHWAQQLSPIVCSVAANTGNVNIASDSAKNLEGFISEACRLKFALHCCD